MFSIKIFGAQIWLEIILLFLGVGDGVQEKNIKKYFLVLP